MSEPLAPMVYAGFWKRFNAYGIDSFFVVVISWLIGWKLGDAFAQTPDDLQALVDSGLLPASGNPKDVMHALFADGSMFNFNDVVLPAIVSCFYNIFFVAGNWQATPGKHWCKIKVVMKDGRRLTLTESAIRHVCSGLSMWPLGLGYVPMFFNREKLALHDMICNTRVIMR